MTNPKRWFQRTFLGQPEEIPQPAEEPSEWCLEVFKEVCPFGEHPELHWFWHKDGEPWFFADIVCEGLTIKDASDAVESLDADEKGKVTIPTLGGPQKKLIVSEPGLYALILKSRKPEAKAFSRWIRHDVLPSIRKTGSYTMPTAREANYQKRIKGSPYSGKLRTKIADVHNRDKRRVFNEGGGIRDLAAFHNGYWNGLGYSEGSRGARKALGLNPDTGNPWNYQSDVAMALGYLSKTTTERKLADLEEQGIDLPLCEQPALARDTSKQYLELVEHQVNGKLGIARDCRGPILDIVKQIANEHPSEGHA